MAKPSWFLTLATQLSLCFALYLVLNIGQPQDIRYNKIRNGRNPVDLHFITVTGGFWPLNQQTLLLRQIEKAITTYKAKFVVNISELGEDDPLMHNATLSHHSKIPWYTTRNLKTPQVENNFVKRIKISYGKTLDIIAINTGFLQDSSINNASHHLNWLTRTLESSNSNWRIVVGFHPLTAFDEKNIDPLHNVFLKHGVDAYMSGADQMGKRPYFTTVDKNLVAHEEMVNGFLLHRVSSLEIVTYLVSLRGEVVKKISIKQRGREVM